MFYCQHVLGMGHVIRSLEIIRALRSFDVTFINGGAALPDLRLPPDVNITNLPAILSDGEFESLQLADPSHSLERIQEERKKILLSTFEKLQPDVLILELFPFGRIRFANELIPLLARIRLNGVSTTIVCSLRDILVGKSDQIRHEEWVCSLMNRYFDLLLVHSDPHFQQLEETFSRTQDLNCPIVYTGFVAQSVELKSLTELGGIPEAPNDSPLIVVSIGGGRVGYELLESAIQATFLLAATMPCRMVIFTGPYLPQEQFDALQTLTLDHPHLSLIRYSPDFLSYLHLADLSISMAGYNTCMNLIATGTQALVLPFTGRGNEEQTIRARKLEALGLVRTISEEQLKPEIFSTLIATHRNSSVVEPNVALDIQGAQKTASALDAFLKQREQVVPSNSLSTSSHPSLTPDWQKELLQSLDALQEHEKPLHLFLRDDDIDTDEDTLRTLCDITLSQGVPLNLEVIPGALTPSVIRFLKNLKRIDPSLIELNQHGWLHLNHEKEERKCEFGPSRNFEEQFQDISKGKAILEDALAERFFPVFTPPWNRLTVDTFRALDELGFYVLSKDRGKQPVTGYGFREISTTLDLYRWKGGPTMKSPQEIVNDLISQMANQRIIGLLLHHKVMDTPAYSFLDDLLRTLRRSSLIRFHSFHSLVGTLS